jgi:metallophosphoesterase (TIGR00282 family)
MLPATFWLTPRGSWASELRLVNVLMIGDIVGPDAVDYLAERLPGLRRGRDVDLVIANAENCAVSGPLPWSGFGMTVGLVERLLAGGVDVITSGNHGWDGPEADAVHAHPRVLRPLNLPDDVPGKGTVTLEVGAKAVTVVNLGSRTAAMPKALPLYQAFTEADPEGTVLVDLHGDSAWEKMEFATAVDGRVAAVLGTHTHEPTLNLHVLPGGTGFVADVGMTGPTGFPGGFPLTHFAAEMKGEDKGALPPFELAAGPTTLGAVLLLIEDGKTSHIERVSWPGGGRGRR